jgi:hypothetical protein
MQKFDSWEDAFGLTQYNWDELTDGSIWTAKQDVDFSCDTTGFRFLLGNIARERELKVVTHINKTTVEFRFSKGILCKK